MKLVKLAILTLSLQILPVPSVFAGDFAWLDDLNVSANADVSEFHIKLATRFRVDDAEVKAVISNVDIHSQ